MDVKRKARQRAGRDSIDRKTVVRELNAHPGHGPEAQHDVTSVAGATLDSFVMNDQLKGRCCIRGRSSHSLTTRTQFAVDARPVDSQSPRRLGDVTARFGQGTADQQILRSL